MKDRMQYLEDAIKKMEKGNNPFGNPLGVMDGVTFRDTVRFSDLLELIKTANKNYEINKKRKKNYLHGADYGDDKERH